MCFEMSQKLEKETAYCVPFLKTHISCFRNFFACIMSSALMDFVDKLFSFSAKMKGESSKLSGSSYLMNVNSNPMFQQLIIDDFHYGPMGNAIMNGETSHQVMPLKQPLGYPTGNYSFSFRNAEKLFSHPLSNFAMDIYRHSQISSEIRVFPNDTLVSHLVNSCNQLPEMNFELIKPPIPSVSKANMSTKETHSFPKKKCEVTDKCTVPDTLTLNRQLANRKTKEMQKRSKKRRRRQKKNQQLDSSSVSDDDVDSSVTSSLTSLCVVSDNAEFGCTVAVSHSFQMSPNNLSSFAVSVNSASDDDSEWESYEAEQFNSSCQVNQEIVGNILISDIVESKSSEPVDCGNQNTTTFISSFMVPVESSTDDESDWDSCETEIFNEMSEFEFTGLLVTSLCTSQTNSFDSFDSINNYGEDDETVNLRIHLQKVNKIWNESTKDIEVKPKLPSKISFAPDEALAEVFPVEIYDRKGVWEIYATERLRFKRRIDELEKILSPCLHPDHRSKMFKKINESIL